MRQRRSARPTSIPRVLAICAVLVAMPGVLRADQPASDGAGADRGTTTPAASESEAGGKGCPVLCEANALLDRADAATGAAVHWLDANLSPRAVSAMAESARTAARCRWRALIGEARAETERDLGVFLYTPSSGTACGGDWTPVSDLAHGPDRAQVVLLVHGLDEPGDIWDDLAPTLSEAGLVVARFNYRDDQDPALSADALAAAMRGLKKDLGVRRVDLVCHSMGGLVARDVLTREAYYAADGSAHGGFPDVGRLIMIGTPNHGSPLAPLRVLGEVREQFVRWFDSEATGSGVWLGFLVDGDGAAGEALDPDSAYLADLNGRGLPRGVKMTVIIGRVSPVTSADVEGLLEGSWFSWALGSARTDRLCAEAGNVVGMLGDAIVPMGSARLEGVSDTVILEGNHRSMVRRMALIDSVCAWFGEKPSTPPAIPVILNRLTDEGAIESDGAPR